MSLPILVSLHEFLQLLSTRVSNFVAVFRQQKPGIIKYFYLPHRNEARGIGGIFFDYKKDNWEKDFTFIRDVGLVFKDIFNSIIVNKNKKKWNINEKDSCNLYQFIELDISYYIHSLENTNVKTGINKFSLLNNYPLFKNMTIFKI